MLYLYDSKRKNWPRICGIRRWKTHHNNLIKGNHNTLFQNLWNDSNITDWHFKVLECNVAKENRFEREQYWMEKLPEDKRLNILSPIHHFIQKKDNDNIVLDMLRQGEKYRTINLITGTSLGKISNLNRKLLIS